MWVLDDENGSLQRPIRWLLAHSYFEKPMHWRAWKILRILNTYLMPGVGPAKTLWAESDGSKKQRRLSVAALKGSGVDVRTQADLDGGTNSSSVLSRREGSMISIPPSTQGERVVSSSSIAGRGMEGYSLLTDRSGYPHGRLTGHPPGSWI